MEFLFALMTQFYIGNDDFHLKNFALIEIQKNGKYKRLSPLYDCINTESLLRNSPGRSKEMAIDFFENHKTSTFKKYGHVSYQTFAHLYDLAGVSVKLLDSHIKRINKEHEGILTMVRKSLLNEDDKVDFVRVLNERLRKLNFLK